ncbi:MAG: hypothetical protein AB8B83_00260 [Bdellovibrionales bacterium]
MTELRSDWPQIILDIDGKRLGELAKLFADPASFKGIEDVEPIQTDAGKRINDLLKAQSEHLSAGFNGARDTLRVKQVLASSESQFAFEASVTGVGNSGFALQQQDIGVRVLLSPNPEGEGHLFASMEISALG